MDFKLTSQKISQAVKSASNILLVIHRRPDADAIGSMLAFSEWLDVLGKNYISFCREVSSAPEDTFFLVDPETLPTDPKVILDFQPDLIIVFDSGDLKYAGVDDVIPKFKNNPFIINIDHHLTNKNFGDINLTNPSAASTTEILYQFFQVLGVKISSQSATALLAGLVNDTYSFTNPNITYRSLEIASQLLLAGAKLSQVTESILKNKTIEILKLWGKVLFRLSRHPQFNIVTTVITQEDLPDLKQRSEVMDGVANFLNNLANVKAVLILHQQEPGVVKGSLRTNSDLIDVAELAKMLGGGGHQKAAGFKVNGEIVRVDSGGWQII